VASGINNAAAALAALASAGAALALPRRRAVAGGGTALERGRGPRSMVARRGQG
jgi:hypothetical protein